MPSNNPYERKTPLPLDPERAKRFVATSDELVVEPPKKEEPK